MGSSLGKVLEFFYRPTNINTEQQVLNTEQQVGIDMSRDACWEMVPQHDKEGPTMMYVFPSMLDFFRRRFNRKDYSAVSMV